MSLKVSSFVWQYSHQASGNLLVLLAIADHADEQGEAWPGIPLLARKSRRSERHVRRCFNALADAGELEIFPNASPVGGPLYRIRLEPLAPNVGTAAPTKVTPASDGADVGVTLSIRESSEEPSFKPDSHSAHSDRIRKTSSRPELDEVIRFAHETKDLDPSISEIYVWRKVSKCC